MIFTDEWVTTLYRVLVDQFLDEELVDPILLNDTGLTVTVPCSLSDLQTLYQLL